MTRTAVTARGLAKRYGETHAVDGIDLEIETGEVFAILGPNGAGKSTTAVRRLTGDRHPTSLPPCFVYRMTIDFHRNSMGGRPWES